MQRAALLNCIAWFAMFIFPLLLMTIWFIEKGPVFHLLLFFSGWLCWTFTEYCIHRFEDHGASCQRGEKPEKIHHYHHRHPTEIAITPLHRAGLLLLCAVLIICAAWWNNYFTLVPGFVTGFTIYTFTHWFLHLKMSARIFPELHRFHIHHHCKHPDKCFGITVTWWDHLFGTIPLNNTIITDRIRTFYYKKENKVAVE